MRRRRGRAISRAAQRREARRVIAGACAAALLAPKRWLCFVSVGPTGSDYAYAARLANRWGEEPPPMEVP